MHQIESNQKKLIRFRKSNLIKFECFLSESEWSVIDWHMNIHWSLWLRPLQLSASVVSANDQQPLLSFTSAAVVDTGAWNNTAPRPKESLDPGVDVVWPVVADRVELHVAVLVWLLNTGIDRLTTAFTSLQADTAGQKNIQQNIDTHRQTRTYWHISAVCIDCFCSRLILYNWGITFEPCM